jgi:hypothetical protein
MCRLDTLVLTRGVRPASCPVQRARAAEELAAFEAKQAAAKRAQVRPAGLAAPSSAPRASAVKLTSCAQTRAGVSRVTGPCGG